MHFIIDVAKVYKKDICFQKVVKVKKKSRELRNNYLENLIPQEIS